MVGDIGNVYLEEKVYFIAGPEFGELKGHTMLIVKTHWGWGWGISRCLVMYQGHILHLWKRVIHQS